MEKREIRQLDLAGEIYAAIDERGSILGTGTREVCEFLVLLANRDLKIRKEELLPRSTRAIVRSAIEI